MKKYSQFFFVLILLFLPFTAVGGLKVNLKLKHGSFLRFEPVIAYVSVYNDSGDVFIIDKDDKQNKSRLIFIIGRNIDEPVVRINRHPLIENLRILPDEKQNIKLNIAGWYDIKAMGRYFVKAVIKWNGKTIESNNTMINIVSGIEITNVSKEAPGHPDSIRKYSLRYWPREKKEYLFLCVNDEMSGINYGVFSLGSLVRVSKPAIKIDRSGNIKILHQSGINCYTLSAFKSFPDKVCFIDQNYQLQNGAPYPFATKEK